MSSSNNDLFTSDAAEERKEALHVEIKCVTPPSEQQLEKIRSFMKAQYHAENVEFVIKRDPSVIGGYNNPATLAAGSSAASVRS